MKFFNPILISIVLLGLTACATPTFKHPEYGKNCDELAPGGIASNVDCVRVFYGTNRPIKTASSEIGVNVEEDIVSVEGGPAQELSLGRADIWLPKLVSHGGTRELGETPLLKGNIPKDKKELSKYVFITRITKNGRQRFVHSLEEDLAQGNGRGILLFIHGFNVKFESALIRSAQLSVDLNQDGLVNPGVPVLFSWPSAGKLTLGNYKGDGALAADAVPHLTAFLDILTNDVDIKKINIIAHSMGNRVLIGSLEVYAATYLEKHPNADIEFRIILAAADVERDIFDQVVGKLESLDPNVTIYTSDNDMALIMSKIVNGDPRLGDTDKNKPYIRSVEGFETVDATPVASELFGLGHGYYSSNPFILGDIRCVLAGTLPNDRALARRRYADQSDKPEYFMTDANVEPFHEECSLVRTTKPNDNIQIGFGSSSGSGRGPAPSPKTESESGGELPKESYGEGKASGKVVLKPGIVILPESIISPISITLLFENNVFSLTKTQEERLLNLLSVQGSYDSVLIESFTDTRGSKAQNQILSERRARSLAKWLVSNGVEALEITTIANGENNLEIDTIDGVSEPLNRRVVITFKY